MKGRGLLTAGILVAALGAAAQAAAYTVTVEGNPDDWGLAAGVLPVNDNTGLIVRGVGSGSNHVGEYVWRDPQGDERTNFSSTGDGIVDITSFHVTSNATNLYFMLTFAEAPSTGANRVTQVQIAIDRDRTVGSGQTALGRDCDTSVADDAAWEYLVVTRFGVGGGPFVFDTSFVDQNSGTAIEGTDPVRNAIEIGVPWSMIDGVPGAPIRFTVVSLRANNSDVAQDISGGSDVLDAVTVRHPGLPASTELAVQDGVVNFNLDLWFHLDPQTEPKAPLLISEVFPAADAAGAWVELVNLTGVELDLSGLGLGDQADVAGSGEGMVLFPGGATIAAGQALVVAGEADDYYSRYGFNPSYEVNDVDELVPDMEDDPDWDGASLLLEVAGDEVLLLDRSFTVLDVVAWGSGAYPSIDTPATAPAAGRSLSRLRAHRDSDGGDGDLEALASPTPRAATAPCADAFGTALAETTPCSLGDPCSVDACDAAGACQLGTPITCSDDGNECTNDICDDELVLGCYRPLTAGTACDDLTTDDCEAAQCNGLGSCDQSFGDEPPGTACPDPDEDDCKVAQCDGAGACDPVRGNEAPGSPCPDQSPEDCTAAACDGSGSCDQSYLNVEPGQPCPDITPEDCQLAICDAVGNCIQTADIRDTNYECRPSGGLCDPAEFCNGADVDCPDDVKSSGECRASRGVCDPPESCDGVSDACPADDKSTDECRPAAGACDVAEFCDGAGDHCPSDDKSTARCRLSSGDCDPAEYCDGQTNDCPPDQKSSAECRASAGMCDAPEYCDGVGDDCPVDRKLTSECRASQGECDVVEVCDGVNNDCPADGKSYALCRAAAHGCDVAEFCDGVGNACPLDLLAPALTPCDDGDACTEKTQCDGLGVCTGGLDWCADGGLVRDAGAVEDAGPPRDAGPPVDAARPDGAQPAVDVGDLPPPIDALPGIGCGGCQSMSAAATPQWCFALGLLFLLFARLRLRF